VGLPGDCDGVGYNSPQSSNHFHPNPAPDSPLLPFPGNKMLKNTFIHITGLGIKTEQRIWSFGVHCWDDLLSRDYEIIRQL